MVFAAPIGIGLNTYYGWQPGSTTRAAKTGASASGAQAGRGPIALARDGRGAGLALRGLVLPTQRSDAAATGCSFRCGPARSGGPHPPRVDARDVRGKESSAPDRG